MSDLVKEKRLPGDIVDVLAPKHRLGHAREVREFVDHPPEVADLPDDRARKSLERLRIGLDLLAETPLKAFRGQLNRGQRVLDFVRDTAGDIRPGRAALI